MTWYDKMTLAGIILAFLGAMMFITGLGYMLSARREAMTHYRQSIEQAREDLRKR